VGQYPKWGLGRLNFKVSRSHTIKNTNKHGRTPLN